MSNELYLDLDGAHADYKAQVRANALFIYSKLVEGGMEVKVAKKAVETLFEQARELGWNAGDDNGYDRGYNRGYDDGRSEGLE